MGLFNWKKENKEDVLCPVEGKVIDITEVNDPIFAGEELGTGIGIIPQKDLIVSPVSGEIQSIFTTKHAVGIKASNGVEYILHIGINTVELNGKGFQLYVKTGQKIKSGQKLVKVDFDLLKEKGYDTTVMLIIVDRNGKNPIKNLGEHKANDVIISFDSQNRK